MSKPQLLKYTEWQTGSGKWYCNDTSCLTSVRSMWYTPARLLNLPLENFVQMLINDFEVDYITLKNKTLIYSWDEEHYALCHKFVLWINAEARKRKFII